MRSVEISLKEILVYILYKWIPILLCGVIMASLISGYSFLKIPRGEALERIKEANQKIVADNEAEILVANTEIAKLEKYIDNIQSISSFSNKKKANIVADIAFDPITVDIARIRSGYTSMFRSMRLQDVLFGLVPADYSDDHLRLLVRVGIKSDAKSPNKLTITALGGDGFDAQAVVEKIYDDYAKHHTDKLSPNGEHTLTFVDSSLADASKNETLYEEEVKKQRTAINEHLSAIAYYNDIISQTRQSERIGMSSLIRPAVIGLLIGIILGVVIASLSYVIRLVIVIPEQIQERLNIRYLGGLHYRPALTLGKLAETAAGHFLYFRQKNEAIDYIATNLNEMAREKSSLLITGSLSPEIISAFAKDLSDSGRLISSAKVIVSPDITTTADGIKQLIQADDVILVERIGSTTLKRVKRQSDRIALSGKNLIGYVLY